MPRRRTTPVPKPARAELPLATILQATAAEIDPTPDYFSDGDIALIQRDYAKASELYAMAPNVSEATLAAKRGFCLAMLGRDCDAEKLLTLENVGDHPDALAVLAWVLAGQGGERLRGFGSAEKQAERARRQASVDQLLAEALAVERPSSLVFNAAINIVGSYGERSYALAERARRLYPSWGWAHAVYATRHRQADTFDETVLDDLLRTMTVARHAKVYEEAYLYALKVGRFDDADQVVTELCELVSPDAQPDDDAVAAIAEMRAMICLHRGRAGDAQAYRQVADHIAPFMATDNHSAGERSRRHAPKFLLQAALEQGESAVMAAAAGELLERYQVAPTASIRYDRRLCDWSPMISAKGMTGVLHCGHFDFTFPHAWRAIAACLDEPKRTQWLLLAAADAAPEEQAAPEQVALLRETDTTTAPAWLLEGIYSAFVDYQPYDFRAAGALLAAWVERHVSSADGDDGRDWEKHSYPDPDVQGSAGVVDLFEGALEWLERTPSATGQNLLRWWAECLAENGGKRVLAEIANLSLSRAESAVARSALELAETPDEEPEPTTAAEHLSRYPDPDATRVTPKQLTLLEAASLIALLRACPLDHARWTLRPLKDAGLQRFEPTNKFITTLFSLMQKGVIAADASTPASVFSLKEGRLYAFLDRVVWRVSPHTLELQRDLRELPHSAWPKEWRAQAAMLSRDLGVEELTVYLERLLEDRSLPVPEEEEVRAIFRVQLEHLAIAQCYYLAHKTMKSALDYQATYRPGTKQLQSRTINLLRENGERAVEHGWDTRYRRAKELPASFLSEALHDVLTGWGRRAFEEPVLTLTLGETPSTTRH